MQTPAELEIARGMPPLGCSVAEAERYTRWLATYHYENFNVASWLLPRRLHQHFYNLYAYCRWADDLGDEIADPARALELLNSWDQELRDCYAGRPSHPVFIALRQTISACDIPIEPFSDLLVAFRQDQTVDRYSSWNGVFDYCRYSANPVGRLVLYLCGYRDAERQQLSDATCTALQLANFWQDVGRDLDKGRIYIPLESLAAHGLTEDDIVARRFDARYVSLMKDLIARTRELFQQGMPLAARVDPALRVDIEMFSRGGLAVLDSIEAIGHNTLQHRPSIPKSKQLRLLLRALVQRLFARDPARVPAAPSGPALLAIVEGGCLGPNIWKIEDAANSGVAWSYSQCHQIARASRSNFYYAFYLLPTPKRDGLAALYAFMRLVDDVADLGEDLQAAQQGLAKWRAAFDEAVTGRSQFFDGTAAKPFEKPLYGEREVLPALVDTMRRYNMPARYLHDLISGAEMDLTVKSYPTFDRLREYCYRVAGTVGLTCTHVFGYHDPRALDLAEKLGLAFQLTNIIRDVHEDAALGRVYIPDEDLARYGVAAEDFSRSEATLGVREVLRFEADRAWRIYEECSDLLDLVDADSRSALWLLVHTYSALLARLESVDFAVFGERVRLSKAEKMIFIARARFGRLTRNNVLEKRDRDRRRPGGTLLGRRAG
jgi:squalene synthase HpnC/squalene synthase HpnD